ncbi:MAG TPA: exodeoxyribonuclease VII large subunit, partial [Acidimicrobiales bacterium]|nr:exodeoxyribonuclease VII large subunit [Acidimicrobiales bacterium]
MTLFSIEPSGRGDDTRRVSLVRLSAEIHRGLAAIGRIAVEGEVHRPSTRPGGRIYFVLKDRAAQITVTVPATRARKARAVGGERVRVTGTLDWFAGGGAVQLVADEVVPVGEGAVAAMIAEARARLAAEGLLDRPRRRIPRLPAAIGVVCGSDAAVRHDIESVVAARFPGYPLVFREVTVSGPGAADAIAGALSDLDGVPEVEVIVLARGGGDATQLLPFSDEDLCRAVCRSTTPVVSAIGHEQDRPLCDEVADLRCGTPSLAAAAVVPDLARLTADLDALAGRASDVARRAGERAAGRLA